MAFNLSACRPFEYQDVQPLWGLFLRTQLISHIEADFGANLEDNNHTDAQPVESQIEGDAQRPLYQQEESVHNM